MEDKILKQIESEAFRRFPVELTRDKVDENSYRRKVFTENCEWYHNNIKESVDVKLTFIKHNNNLMQYAGFTYTKMNGVYGYLGIDGNDVIFIYNDERGVVKDILDTHEIVVEYFSASQNTESNEGEWISVKDMLPEKEGHYLVYCPKSFPKNYRAVVGEFYDDNKTFYSESSDSPIEDATHWCYIPTIEPINPPKEK